MKMMLVPVILAFVVLGAAQAPSIPGSPDDEAQIRKIIAGGEDAWNRRDAAALLANMSENHDHINVDGAWRSGKAQTATALTAALAAGRIHAATSVARLRFLTSDVAIAVVRYEYSTDQKRWQSIATSVFHKVDGRWLNEAFQNTLVQPTQADSAARAVKPDGEKARKDR